MFEWAGIYLVAALLVAFFGAGWALRGNRRAAWVWAYCVVIASALSHFLLSEHPSVAPFTVALATLFPFLLLVGAFGAAEQRAPRWIVPTGLAVAATRALCVLAELPGAAALLSLLFEPAAAIAAAVVYHRAVVPQRLSPLTRWVSPWILVVGGVEAWDAIVDLGAGPMQAPWTIWFAAAVPLAAILIVSAIDDDRRQNARLEQARREAERRFRALTESSRDLIMEVDSEGRVAYTSPNLREILGYEPEATAGMHLLEIAHGFTEPRPSTPRGSPPLTELKREDFPKLWRIRGRDGAWHWFETSANRFRTEAGRLHVIAISRDVTERIEAAEERDKLEAQMQQSQRLKSLGVLAGGIAHDFGNLLVGILGNAELLRSQLEPNSTARRYLDDILEASEQASQLTDQLLAYAGESKSRMETVSLGPLVLQMIQLMRASSPATCELREEIAEPACWIQADPTQVRQVVMNLIANAADSLEGHAGIVTVKTGLKPLGASPLEGGYVAGNPEPGLYGSIEVSDTGCGIEPEDLDKIFDPFFSTKVEGHGLGLAAVLGIVGSHRGALRVESTPSRGTRFQVFLPLADRPDTVEASPARAEHGPGRALVVDDQDLVRTASARLLQSIGYSVSAARSGPEALETFSEQPSEFAFVLLDMTMPGMGGDEVFSKLRAIREDVPVIFMSGYSPRDLDSQLADERRVGRLRKPFRRDDLAREIQRVTGPAPTA